MRCEGRRPRPASLPSSFLDFHDPWGNRIEIVGYGNIHFTKAPHVLRDLGLSHLGKTEQAIKELMKKGMEDKSGSEWAPPARETHSDVEF